MEQQAHETFEVGLGPSGPFARVRVSAGVVKGLLRLITSAQITQLVHIADARAEVYVPEKDHGRISVSFVVVNFSRRRVTVEDLHLTWVRVGNGSLHDPRPQFAGQGHRLEPRSLTRFFVDVALHPVDIRNFRSWVGEAQNRFSTPVGGVDLEGHLKVRWRRKDWRVPLSIEHLTPRWAMFDLTHAPGNP